MPKYRMYWNPTFRFAPTADTMGHTRFEKIKQFFHINDNSTRNINVNDPDLFKFVFYYTM